MLTAFFKAATWRVVSIASLLLTSLYSLWLFTSYLSPERYGVIALALTVTAYIPYLDGGFRTVISRHILATKDPAERDTLITFGQKLYTWLGVGVVLANVLVLTLYAFAPGIRTEGIPLSFFLFFAISNALFVFAYIQWGIFVGAQEQSKFFILQTLSAWLSVNALAWAFARGWELWSIPFSTLIAALAAYPLSLRWIRQSFPGIKFFDLITGPHFWSQFHRLKSEAWFCFRAQFTTFILYSADILIIGYFSPKAEVAVYYVMIRLVGTARSVLQTGGDVGWPFLAQRGGASRDDAIPWFGLHGWIYGSVAGALVVVAIPFCTWYLGRSWTVSPELLWLIVLRFLIVGLGSSASFLLYALGEFRPITKSIEWELIGGLILGTIGGYLVGSTGVAAGFLLATAGGTLVPIYIAYAARGTLSFWEIYRTVWSRAIVGFLGSFFTATLLLKTFVEGIYTPFIASAAVGVSLALAFFFALSRRKFDLHFDSRQLRQLLRKI